MEEIEESAEEFVKRIVTIEHERYVRELMWYYKNGIESATEQIEKDLKDNTDYNRIRRGTVDNVKLYSNAPDQLKKQFENGGLGNALNIIWMGNLKQAQSNIITMDKFIETNKKEIEELRERREWYEEVYEELKKLGISELDYD